MTDPSSVSITDYREWYSHYSSMVGPNITDCSLEKEMNKVRDGLTDRYEYTKSVRWWGARVHRKRNI